MGSKNQREVDARALVLSVPEKDYGENYRDHFLQIYFTCLDMADKISDRRQSANSFFLSINSAIIAFFGYTASGAGNVPAELPQWQWIFAAVGVLLCWIWRGLIISYKRLNSAKFKIILEMEKHLPAKPFGAEWELLEKGQKPKIYRPFTTMEQYVPVIFMALHVIIIIFAAGFLR